MSTIRLINTYAFDPKHEDKAHHAAPIIQFGGEVHIVPFEKSGRWEIRTEKEERTVVGEKLTRYMDAAVQVDPKDHQPNWVDVGAHWENLIKDIDFKKRYPMLKTATEQHEILKTAMDVEREKLKEEYASIEAERAQIKKERAELEKLAKKSGAQ